MTQVEASPSFVLFTEAGNGPEDRRSPLDEVSTDYFRRRESAERAAAKRAKSGRARSVHQDLAQRYAKLSRRREE